ncbi:MAG: hypothetical protein GY829_10435, partial [Gammaproteobacteria bacterium]|nr:hypothetical protein [Gammaproteobacteria bacterium]
MSAPEKAVYDDIYFETLTAWEASIPADLVAADEQWVAECYNDWPNGLDDGNFSVDSRTTDTTRKIIITVADGEGHNGIDHDSGFFVLVLAWNSFINNSDYTEVKGISFYKSTSPSAAQPIVWNKADNGVIFQNLMSTVGGGSYGAYCYSLTGNNETAINCIAKNVNNSGVGFRCGYNAAPTSEVLNCTAVAGSKSGDTMIFKNTASFYNIFGDFDNISPTSTNNASDLGVSAHSSCTVTELTDADFTDPANGDYSVAAGSQLIDAGTDLSSEFTTDIIG